MRLKQQLPLEMDGISSRLDSSILDARVRSVLSWSLMTLGNAVGEADGGLSSSMPPTTELANMLRARTSGALWERNLGGNELVRAAASLAPRLASYGDSMASVQLVAVEDICLRRYLAVEVAWLAALGADAHAVVVPLACSALAAAHERLGIVRSDRDDSQHADRHPRHSVQKIAYSLLRGTTERKAQLSAFTSRAYALASCAAVNDSAAAAELAALDIVSAVELGVLRLGGSSLNNREFNARVKAILASAWKRLLLYAGGGEEWDATALPDGIRAEELAAVLLLEQSKLPHHESKDSVERTALRLADRIARADSDAARWLVARQSLQLERQLMPKVFTDMLSLKS